MSTQTINVKIPLDLIIDQVSKDLEKRFGRRIHLEDDQKKDIEKETWLTRIETAKKLKVSLPTLRKYSTLGVIKVYYFGSNPRYKLSDVEDTLKELPTLKHKHNI